MSRKLFSLILIGLLVVAGIPAALAQDGTITIDTEDAGTIVGIGDGRLNAFDQAAPVAIYYTNECSEATNDLGQRFQPTTAQFVDANACTRLDILSIDPVTGNGSLALQAYPEDIADIFATDDHNISENGVTLNVREDGQFWIETAPNFEGKVYTFAWFDEGRTLQQMALPEITVTTEAVVATPAVTATVEASATEDASTGDQ